MNARRASLPLGVDVGRRRVRIARMERDSNGRARLIAVAACDHDGDPLEALLAALDELNTAERRCVLALAAPDAVLCSADFPAMSRWERVNAARFEAARFIDYAVAEAAVSLVPTTVQQRWAIGIARRSALAAASINAKRAGLHPLAIDDAAFALQRAQPEADAVIDIGSETTRLTIFGGTIPYVVCIPIGGERLTEGIAHSLGVDTAAAEERKRRIGFGGAGEAQRDVLISALGEGFAEARTGGYTGIRHVVLCGNGSRVPGMDAAIERATGYAVRPATLPPELSDTLPPDVLRAAAPDWSVAYGLSLWSIAS